MWLIRGRIPTGESLYFFNRWMQRNIKWKVSRLSRKVRAQIIDESTLQFCRFLYTSAIPFNVVRNPEFSNMIHMIDNFSTQASFITWKELYLWRKKVQKMINVISEYKGWKKTVRTIMSDGWTDRKRSLYNYSVNGPKGTVLLSSSDSWDGIWHIRWDIRVGWREKCYPSVTDNASNYKWAGDLLMVISWWKMLSKYHRQCIQL
jgi:hypothetical protein